MRRLIFLFAFTICYTTITIAQGADVGKIETTYYVSSSNGDDGNDGLTTKTPKKHISAVEEKKNVRIRLKRGDVFFEQMIGYNNCIIEDYGIGDKPVLCGFKVLMNPQAWTYDEQEGLWKIDLTEESNFAGCLHGNVADDRINNVGFIYDPNRDKVYGRRVKEKKELTENGWFYLTNLFVLDSVKNDTFRWLRWKYDKDPRRIKYLCFSMWLIAVRFLQNCDLQNIAIVGFNFGVVNCSGTSIDNCQIDLIGGSVQLGASSWVRYGNGIEYTCNNSNDLVTNCLISRTYDCGTTIQANGNITSSPKNIHFRNNRFYHCRQAFEFFLNLSNGFDAQYENCSFIDNICYLMGDNEFSSPEPRDANLLSYDNIGKDISIENNTFFGASHFYRASYPTGMQKNSIYLYEGQYLCHRSKGSLTSIYANNKNDLASYLNKSGDNSFFVIMQKGSDYSRHIEHTIRRKVDWKPVNLRLKRQNKSIR